MLLSLFGPIVPAPFIKRNVDALVIHEFITDVDGEQEIQVSKAALTYVFYFSACSAAPSFPHSFLRIALPFEKCVGPLANSTLS